MMRNKLAVFAILVAAALPLGASAQGLNAGLGSSMGGVGISRHGTGFDGTQGDPLYQVNQAPGQFIPGRPVTNHPSVSDAGAAPVILILPPEYAPLPPPIQFQFPPAAR
jgi:hypothetical protein